MSVQLSGASIALNRYGSQLTSSIPGPIRDIVGIGLNFRRFKEPHLSYKWEFVLPKLSFKQVPSSAQLSGFIPTIVGCSVPFNTFDTEDIYVNTHKYNLPIATRTERLSLKVLHETDGKALLYFECWKSAIKDQQGRYQYQDVYKKDIVFRLLTYSNSVLNEIRLSGVFPVSVSPLSLTYDSSDGTYFDVELSVDYTPLQTLSDNILAFNNLTTSAGNTLSGFF